MSGRANISGLLMTLVVVWGLAFWWGPRLLDGGSGGMEIPEGVRAQAQREIVRSDQDVFADRENRSRSERVDSFSEDAEPAVLGTDEVETRDSGVTPRYYIVRRGDRLENIAKEHLGSRQAVRVLLELNPQIDPTKMRPGDRIRMPDGWEGGG